MPRTDLEVAYEIAYQQHNPSLMDPYLQTFEDCVWLYENSVKDFKSRALKKAASKVNSWDEFTWLMKHVYSHLIVEKNREKIRATKNEIQKTLKDN